MNRAQTNKKIQDKKKKSVIARCLRFALCLVPFAFFFASCEGKAASPEAGVQERSVEMPDTAAAEPEAPAAAGDNGSITGGLINDTRLNGTWFPAGGSANEEMRMDSGNFELFNPQAGFSVSRGTYTVSGNEIVFTVTHSWGGPFDLHYTSLYTKDEVKSSIETSIEITDEIFEDYFPGIFISYTAQYFPGNDLWVTEYGTTYRRDGASSVEPMNKIFIAALNFSNSGNRFSIEGDRGFFSFQQGMNTVSVSFVHREAGFLAQDDIFLKMAMDSYMEVETYINDDLDKVRFSFENDTRRINVARRRIIRNNIVLADSFVFGGVQDASALLRREVVFTTNNYFVNILITANMSLFSDDFWYREIAEKGIPYYERVDAGGLRQGRGVSFVFNGETMFFNINSELFGSDIVNRRHPTVEIMQWYDETERILDGLRVE